MSMRNVYYSIPLQYVDKTLKDRQSTANLHRTGIALSRQSCHQQNYRSLGSNGTVLEQIYLTASAVYSNP